MHSERILTVENDCQQETVTFRSFQTFLGPKKGDKSGKEGTFGLPGVKQH